MTARRRLRHAWLVAALAAAGCNTLAPQPPSAAAVPRQGGAHQLIVTLAAAAPEQRDTVRRALATDHAMRELGSFLLASIDVHCAVYELDDAAALARKLARLARDPRVESVQPNQPFEALQAAGEAYRGLAYGAAAIGADRAHRTSTGKGVRVALIDTGVDRRHHELQDRIVHWANFVERGEPSFDGDRHGTAVAGIIGARDGRRGPILGIAPDAELLAIKACWPDGAGTHALCSSWTLAKAIDEAIGAGATVINMSLAGPSDPLLARLLGAAHRRGVSVVAAAADGPSGPGFPASLDTVLAVVASDALDRVPRRARAPRPAMLAAPGIEVVTLAPGDGYALMSGSSLAAAHVSGVIALLQQAAPGLGPSRAAALVQDTARRAADAGADAPGIVDACAALARLRGAPACP